MEFASRGVSRDKAGESDGEGQRKNSYQGDFRETKRENWIKKGRGGICVKGTFERQSGRILVERGRGGRGVNCQEEFRETKGKN